MSSEQLIQHIRELEDKWLACIENGYSISAQSMRQDIRLALQQYDAEKEKERLMLALGLQDRVIWIPKPNDWR